MANLVKGFIEIATDFAARTDWHLEGPETA
jgi:hypothetical protein